MSSPSDLIFENLGVAIPGREPLRFTGTVRAGERVALQGPSGVGKTTFLRVAAGLLPAEGGQVKLGSRVLTGLPPQATRAGFVFQSGALFPYLSVLENVLFGLRLLSPYNGWSRGLQEERARAFLDRVGLTGFADRAPASLSGGERQRVSLVRTLVCDPDFVLLDEPLSAVDAERRREIQDWIVELLGERPVPALIVTHDRAEAERLGTRVITLKETDRCITF